MLIKMGKSIFWENAIKERKEEGKGMIKQVFECGTAQIQYDNNNKKNKNNNI